MTITTILLWFEFLWLKAKLYWTAFRIRRHRDGAQLLQLLADAGNRAELIDPDDPKAASRARWAIVDALTKRV